MSETKDSNEEKMPRKRGCATRRVTPLWLDTSLVAFIILLLFIALPNYIRVNGPTKENVTKSNLHKIQIALEQYAVDHGGQYPPYLIGGEAKFSKVIHKPGFEDDKYSPENRWRLLNARSIGKRENAADILIRKGYLTSYPKNPFATNGPAIHQYQENVGDPLRNGTQDARIHGTRFGANCSLMGNVLGDKRYPGTYADFGYPFYDTYEKGNNKPRPFFPGEFFYRSRSIPIIANSEDGERQITNVVQDYMLGAYGSIRTKGYDHLGPDPTGVNEVSPFGFNKHGVMDYGNPNGIRDSIILVLVPPEDTRGAHD